VLEHFLVAPCIAYIPVGLHAGNAGCVNRVFVRSLNYRTLKTFAGSTSCHSTSPTRLSYQPKPLSNRRGKIMLIMTAQLRIVGTLSCTHAGRLGL